MSSREWGFRIQDIIQAIDKIEKYLDAMTINEFRNDELVTDAVVRNFEIMGEASKHIPSEIRDAHANIPWSQMNAMRNLLIHEYFGVDVDTVWYTAKNYLPPLKKQLQKLSEQKKT